MVRVAPLLFLLLACKKAPDPLAEQRKTCQELFAQKALKPGLSVDDCALQLKAREPPPTAAATPVPAPK
jgi:hypothetical protein